MLEEKRPKLNNVQVFGSTIYAKVHDALKKLDKRNKEYKFVGYAPTDCGMKRRKI